MSSFEAGEQASPANTCWPASSDVVNGDNVVSELTNCSAVLKTLSTLITVSLGE